MPCLDRAKICGHAVPPRRGSLRRAHAGRTDAGPVAGGPATPAPAAPASGQAADLRRQGAERHRRHARGPGRLSRQCRRRQGHADLQGQTHPFIVAGLGVGGDRHIRSRCRGRGLQPQRPRRVFRAPTSKASTVPWPAKASVGDIWLKNPHKVVMHLKAKREGLMLASAARPSTSGWTSERPAPSHAARRLAGVDVAGIPAPRHRRRTPPRLPHGPTSSSSWATTSATGTSAPTIGGDGLQDAQHRPDRPTRVPSSPTITASSAARPAGPPSSPASRRCAPAC